MHWRRSIARLDQKNERNVHTYIVVYIHSLPLHSAFISKAIAYDSRVNHDELVFIVVSWCNLIFFNHTRAAIFDAACTLNEKIKIVFFNTRFNIILKMTITHSVLRNDINYFTMSFGTKIIKLIFFHSINFPIDFFNYCKGI